VENPIAFQFPELLCQRGLCDSVKAAYQFPEPFPHAVPGYRAVPYGARGQVHPCRGQGTPAGTVGVYQESTDKDASVCQLQLKFLSGYSLSAEGEGFRGQ